jgi:hypothetical protein
MIHDCLIYSRNTNRTGRRSQRTSLVSGEVRRLIACWDCGFKSRREHGCLSVMCVICQVEVSASDQSLAQRSPTVCEFGTVCDPETSAMRRPWPALGCCRKEKEYVQGTFTVSKPVKLC